MKLILGAVMYGTPFVMFYAAGSGAGGLFFGSLIGSGVVGGIISAHLNGWH